MVELTPVADLQHFIPLQNEVKSKMAQPVASQTNSLGVQIKCKRLADKQTFLCSAADLYRALTDKDVSWLFSLLLFMTFSLFSFYRW
jgi:hypothetical protein